ncbi:MAG TPA: fibronectin type III domain-containing protein [Candidatus Hypogeohydataceae bacterium YC41]
MCLSIIVFIPTKEENMRFILSRFNRHKPGLLALVFVVILSSSAKGGNVSLVGQLDPFPGDDRYGDVWGEGNYAYIGSFRGSGVGIIDISTPSAPFLAAYYEPASRGQFKDVQVKNGIGYFASDNGGGLHIVDLSNPVAPGLIFNITSAHGGYDSIHNLFVSGNFLYEADSRTPTVKVFDVSNPASPIFVRDILTTDPKFIHDITVVNNRLYTSGWGGKTDIYDVTSIGTVTPTLLGSISSGRASHSNWVTDDGRFLASARESSSGDVRIYDISNPASPLLVSTITKDSWGIDALSPHNPVIMGNLLFVSWYQAGLQVFNISDPSHPILVGSYDTFPGPVAGFDGDWGVYPFLGLDKVLLSDMDGGLFIVDVTSVANLTPGEVPPAAPTNLRAISLSSSKVNLVWTDNSTNETGFEVWRRVNTGSWQLLATTGPNVTKYQDTTAYGNDSTTSYSYFIRAFNNSGFRDTNVAVVPFAPTGLAATAISPSQIDLSWTDRSDNEKDFEVHRKPGPCSATGSWTRIAIKGTDTTSHSNTGLTPGTTYSYRVRAYYRSPAAPYANAYSLWSNCAEATTP